MDKVREVRVLILEDDLEALEFILGVLKEVSIVKQVPIATTVLPDYIQTEQFINKNPQIKFDILLLDRDCFLGGSFHTVNLDNFNKDKVISISSVPEWNRQAKEAGVKRVVYKDFEDLEYFARSLKREVLDLI